MPDKGFGTLITDAFGKFHDISKGAFDSYSIKHEGSYDPGFSKLVNEGFNEAAKDVLAKFGVSKDQLETFGTAKWTDKVVEILEDLTIDAATAGGAVAAEAGPLGAAVALVVATAAPILKTYWQEIKDSFSKIPPKDAYNAGQWISIDNGKTAAVRGMHNVLDDAFADRRRLYGYFDQEVPPQILEEDVDFEENFSTGFYLGTGADDQTVTVFNFLSSRDEQRNIRDVRPLGREKGEQLDNTEVWSEIRLLRFEEEQSDLLDSNVNTDPGSEVIWKTQPYTVLRSWGDLIKIEHKHTGVQHTVSLSELTAGRRSHNNSWNYSLPGREGSTFESGEKAPFTQGDFVWIDPAPHITKKHAFCKRQLACIQYLEGDQWLGYAAIDGWHVRKDINDPRVRGVSDGLNDMFSKSSIFNTFKDAVVRGHDVRRLAAGKHRTAVQLCLGVTPLDDRTEKPKQAWRERAQHWKSGIERDALSLVQEAKMLNKIEGYAGDGGLHDDLDAADELANLGIGKKSQLERDFLEVPGETNSGPAPGGGGGVMLAGLAAVGGLAAFFLR